MTMVNPDGTLLGGRYRLHEELGRGGMSTVYRASDESLGRAVAVKVFSHGLTDAEGLARHRDEVQLLASLSHPGLVTLFDAATDSEADRAYLIMELVTGDDLRTRLDDGPLPPTELALVGRQLAEALSYTHSRGVIHRDVKPGNILLPRRDGEHTGPAAKLADFGIARIVDGDRITATGTVVGTAGYFSPEQALGHDLTGASDIYSLGLVLLEGLTGERAFPGSAAESMAARVTRDPKISTSIDPGWTELLTRMTTRDPDARPTGLEVAEHLGRLAAQSSTQRSADEGTASTESLDSTMRYPMSETQPLTPAEQPPTQPHVQTPDQTHGQAPSQTSAQTTTLDVGAPAPEAPSADATAPAAQTVKGGALRRRLPLIIAGVVAVLVIVVTVIAISLQGATGTQTPPDYPVVEGQIGERLEQLQRSVEP